MSRVLVLGASGMLGSAMIRIMAEDARHEAWGTARSAAIKAFLPAGIADRIRVGVDVDNVDALADVLNDLRPDVIINCIGVVKQLAQANDPLMVLPINAILPHRLARLCALGGARLVHVSTDCVFNGSQGGYTENDASDAEDLYGRSKFLGEVAQPHTITLRTSIIGHQLGSSYGLIGWFLSQQGSVKGYTRAIFSGLPTVELARVVRDIVLPAPRLSGLYHVASSPIAKYDLLKLVAEIYGKTIDIVPDDSVVIDRSLNAHAFREATGYVAPTWPQLIERMHEFR